MGLAFGGLLAIGLQLPTACTGCRFQFGGRDLLPRPPNYPLFCHKYPLLRTIRAPLKGHWGVLLCCKVCHLGSSRLADIGIGFEGLRLKGLFEFRV